MADPLSFVGGLPKITGKECEIDIVYKVDISSVLRYKFRFLSRVVLDSIIHLQQKPVEDVMSSTGNYFFKYSFINHLAYLLASISKLLSERFSFSKKYHW